MGLRHLQTFGAVAELLSFTRAAERLGYAQSSITGQVRALEEELGEPLFERLGKRVALTAAGRRLLPYAEKMLGLAGEARAAAAAQDGRPRGTLTIGASESLCAFRLPAVLRLYRQRFPEVQLILRAGICSQMREDLRAGTLDLAFLLEGPVADPDLSVRQLVQEPMLLLAHPNHHLARAAAITPGDLAGESLLLTEQGCSYRAAFERILAERDVRTGPVLEFGSIEAIKQCIIADLGVALLPAVTVEGELRQGAVVALRWAGPAVDMVTQVAHHRDKWLSPALGAFLEAVDEAMRL